MIWRKEVLNIISSIEQIKMIHGDLKNAPQKLGLWKI